MEYMKQTLDHLMEQLIAEGFPAEQLRENIASGLRMNMPVFHATCSLKYGEERMDYRLTFRQIQGDDLNYRLTELHAVHREAVDIETEDINNVNIADLDFEMSSINWHQYFSEQIRDTTQDGHMEKILASLRSLSNESIARGKFFQQCLMLKHWPETVFQQFQDLNIIDLKKKHEHQYIFSSSNGDQLNAHLAFHVMSERYASLRDLVDAIGLSEINGSYTVDQMLSSNLWKNPDAFVIEGSLNLAEGYARFSVPIEKQEGWYSISEYGLSFTSYPPIEHGIFGGINTEELEAEMRSVNWKDDNAIFIFHENAEPEFRTAVNNIQEKLYRVSQDMSGAAVADLLRLKYFTGVTFFGETIDQSAWNLLDDLPKLHRKFPKGQNITSAAYLLAGRAVFCGASTASTEYERRWMRLDLSNAGGGYPETFIEGSSRIEIEVLLRAVSTSPSDREYIADELMKGKLVHLDSSAQKRVLVEACPEQRTIVFYNEDMRLIPVNLHMDPNWKPPLSQRENIEGHKTDVYKTSGKHPFKKQAKKQKGPRH